VGLPVGLMGVARSRIRMVVESERSIKRNAEFAGSRDVVGTGDSATTKWSVEDVELADSGQSFRGINMPALVPVGYVSVLQAAEMLLPSLYAGRPDSPNVMSLRQKGLDVTDGPAKDDAIAQLWKAVDDGIVTPMAIAGRPRRVIKIDPHLTKTPVLRHPRGRAFTYLRPSHPEFSELAAYFGKDLSKVTVVFPEPEIKALARKLMRSRRVRSRSQGQKRPGRPSRQDFIESIVRQMIEHGRV